MLCLLEDLLELGLLLAVGYLHFNCPLEDYVHAVACVSVLEHERVLRNRLVLHAPGQLERGTVGREPEVLKELKFLNKWHQHEELLCRPHFAWNV